MNKISQIFRKMLLRQIFFTVLLLLTSSSSVKVTNRPTVSPTQYPTGSTLTTSTRGSTTLTTSNGTVMSTTDPHISTSSPSQNGCSDQLSFSPGNFFPGSVTTCYDDMGLMVSGYIRNVIFLK